MRELRIAAADEGQRLDRFLLKYLKKAPASFLYRMLRKKNIVLNGKRAAGSERIAAGDVICLYLSDETLRKFSEEQEESAVRNIPSACDFEVLYRDRDFIFVNKPAGLLTQKADREDISLTEMVRSYLAEGKRETDAAYQASPANRLDRNTSGIVLFGLSVKAQQYLTEVIRRREVKKHYLALVHGKLPEDGIFRVFYRKDPDENRVLLFPQEPHVYHKKRGEERGEMYTGIRKLGENGQFALLEIDLLTGKPHQIRAHLSYLGCPVAGDPKYGDRKLNGQLQRDFGIKRQMLHAYRISFPEGDQNGVLSGKTYTAELPPDMENAVNYLIRS